MDTIVGTRLGAYLVEKRLGQGGMATIFLGIQPSTGRKVAIKTLPKTHLSDAKAIARFEREARVLANLQHPHILPLIDYGEMGDYKFLVMPYLAHGDLEDRLQRTPGPLDLAEARRVLSQLAEALDHAHRQGVIHRDLKPGNVLLDAQGNALLADFGIAHEEGSDRLTGVGFTVGTPEYMAPEQVNGQPEPRSDLYALGVLAFRLLTGVLPFKGATATATLLLQRDVAAPDAGGINPALSAETVGFLRKALAKPLAERYQTGAAFADAVRAVLPERSNGVFETTMRIGTEALPPVDSAERTQTVSTPARPPGLASEVIPPPAVRSSDAFPAADLAVLAAQALAAREGRDTLRSAQPAAAPPPARPGAAAASQGPLYALVATLLIGAMAGAWWFLRPEPGRAPVVEVPTRTVAPAPGSATGGAAADQAAASPVRRSPNAHVFDDFSTSGDRPRWQPIGGLHARIVDGRMRLTCSGEKQWLRAREVPEFSAASVRVQLAPAVGSDAEAAAGLTVSQGDWWISCFVYREPEAGALLGRCMVNGAVVTRGHALRDEPHEVGVRALDAQNFALLIDGREVERFKAAEPAPDLPAELVLSVWAPRASVEVVADFDDVRLTLDPTDS